MKVKINKNLFLKYLKYCNQIIVENIINPIMNCVLIKFLKNKIEFICVSNNSNAKFVLNNEYELDEEFQILIKGKILLNIISKIKDSDINIIKNVDNNLIIKTNNFECELNSLDFDTFPRINFDLNDYNEIKINSEVFKRILAKTIPLANTNEPNKLISGINFVYDKKDNKLICTSTDSFRVCKYEYSSEQISKEEFNFTINAKTLEKISSIIFEDLDNKDEICFYKTNRDIFINTNNKIINLKLMDGNFPNVIDVFKLPSNTKFKVNKQNLTSAIDKAVSIVSTEKTHSIKMEINPNTIEIEAKSFELGYCKESVELQEFEGEKIIIKINGLFLLHLFKNFDNDDVEISITSNSKPIILRDIKDQEFEQLILPIRI